MLFNSISFVFVFLPVTFFVFLILAQIAPAKAVLAWVVLASFAFYSWWDVGYAGLLLALAGINYWMSFFLIPGRLSLTGRKLILSFTIALMLCVLGYFKYSAFIVGIVDPGAVKAWRLDQIVLPLAISFFTFQKIAYLVDVYRGVARPGSMLEYLFFVSFFPQLIAGPIVHWREIAPQLPGLKKRAGRWDDLSVGLSFFAIGMIKKVVVAETVAPVADAVFRQAGSGAPLSFTEAWIGALAFTVQIYFDFSGYSDMAIGLGRMFGIRLPANFDSPYKAPSIIDFWRRWHMTLSHFLRDYLYKPLGGNRHGALRQGFAIAVVMLLGGLWHGAAWTFIAWGGLHGAYILINHAWRIGVPHHETPVTRFLGTGLTFFAVVVGWVFFRAGDYTAAALQLSAMADPTTFALPGRAQPFAFGLLPDKMFTGIFPNLTPIGHAAEPLTIVIIIAGLAGCWLLPNSQQFLEAVGKSTLHWQPRLRWALLFGALTAFAITLIPRTGQFVYFQF